jgi:hypothetical protein
VSTQLIDQSRLQELLGGFFEGMAENAQLLKYQRVTPDAAVALLLVYAAEGEPTYWVSYETDHISGYGDLMEFIEEWANTKVIELAQPLAPIEGAPPVAYTTKPYFAFLAKIEKPGNLGFWSHEVTLKSEADIDIMMKDFSDEEREHVRGIFRDEKPESVSVYDDGTKMEVFFK